MFDDKTYDNIMADMMSDFGQDVRTDESSLAYNACSKQAEQLEDAYADMDSINDNMLPDTQDLDHLISYAKERGVSYNYATAAEVKGSFSQEIAVGTQFSCGDYTYSVSKNIEDYDYLLVCDIEGTEANTTLGELTPIDYVDNYQGGSITEILTLGTDDEDTEVFRARVMDSFQSKAFGGNKADYRLFVDAITGVGGCKPKRRDSNSPYIYITVVSSEYGVPSDQLINTIQSTVDPEENHGEGDGMAPICHSVIVQKATADNVNIETKVTFDDGYSVDTTGESIKNAIDDYLLSLRKGWEQNELQDLIVRISQIDAKILSVEGVLDVEDTTINDEAENMTVAYNKIPIIGEVVINV